MTLPEKYVRDYAELSQSLVIQDCEAASESNLALMHRGRDTFEERQQASYGAPTGIPFPISYMWLRNAQGTMRSYSLSLNATDWMYVDEAATVNLRKRTSPSSVARTAPPVNPNGFVALRLYLSCQIHVVVRTTSYGQTIALIMQHLWYACLLQRACTRSIARPMCELFSENAQIHAERMNAKCLVPTRRKSSAKQ